MKNLKNEDIQKWRLEIEQAEKFKEEEFGSIEQGRIRGVGENIDYFERGFGSKFIADYGVGEEFVSLNIIYPIVKNIIPSLYYRNPYVLAVPKRKDDEMSAPYASATINYFYRELDIKSINQLCIFDAYVLGMGVCKIGYSTQIGIDAEDENLEKEREKGKFQKVKEFFGLAKPKEEEKPKSISYNEYIKSENPYSIWVNPFKFGIDPRATSIHNATYVYEVITTTLDRVKKSKNYKNTADLNGSPIEKGFAKDLPESVLDQFKTIDLYEIHYKTDDGIYILVLAKDGNEYKELRHEKSIYEMDGFQYEVLTFNKHGHKLYPRSDIDVTKGLQDRINLTFENILDQVDKYVSKIAYDETAITKQGELALRDGQLGSMVACNKNPAEVFKDISLTQVKGDLAVFIDKLIDTISLETGITKAMLTGMTSAETATEAQIGQAGQNLRISDKSDQVQEFANRQARKLWQVIKQFVDLEELELITGETSYDEVTGTPKYSWKNPIDTDMREKLIVGEYDFQIEVGSTQKPDLPILRKQIENMVNIIGGQGVLQAFQIQGYKIELAEIFKSYLQLFPDVFRNIGRIIKPIDQTTKGLIPMQQPQQQGGASGNLGVNPQQFQSAPPNSADIISEIGGEKGNIPIA